jgi:aminodeoxyfutalosine deaminase
VGHGIAAAQDPVLLKHLATEQIALEVCPTSNLRTRAVDRIEEHPLPVLVAAGVPVVINTDDPGMFDTDLNREYQLIQDVFGYDLLELAGFVDAGIQAAMCPPARKQQLSAELDEYLAGIDAR